MSKKSSISKENSDQVISADFIKKNVDSSQENTAKEEMIVAKQSSSIHKWNSLLFGFALSILMLAFFFTGAMADRLFVFQPISTLENLFNTNTPKSATNQDGETTQLGEVMKEMQRSGSVADVVDVAGKSVVTVSVKTQQPLYREVPGVFPGFGFRVPSGETEEVQRDIGTGFVVDQANGLVVTNRHVVDATGVEFIVIDIEDKEYAVTNIYRDPIHDLAILKVENLSLPALPLGDSDSVRVGDAVIAIGTALGEFRNTVTTGVISGKGRGIVASSGFYADAEKLENVFQTDAAVNPGNSGGPLISFMGEVIGVNVATSVGADNISFSIPINEVKAVLQNFNETGQFERARLGVQYEQISARAALLNDWPQGAYITFVQPGSAAGDAGLQVNDIIFKIDGELIKEKPLSEIINTKKAGDSLKLTIWRNGEEKELQVTLKSMSQ